MNQRFSSQGLTSIVGATLAVALVKQNQPVSSQGLTNIVGATLAVALVTMNLAVALVKQNQRFRAQALTSKTDLDYKQASSGPKLDFRMKQS